MASKTNRMTREQKQKLLYANMLNRLDKEKDSSDMKDIRTNLAGLSKHITLAEAKGVESIRDIRDLFDKTLLGNHKKFENWKILFSESKHLLSIVEEYEKKRDEIGVRKRENDQEESEATFSGKKPKLGASSSGKKPKLGASSSGKKPKRGASSSGKNHKPEVSFSEAEEQQFKKDRDDTIQARTVHTWSKAMESVCIMHGIKGKGTGFRVGDNFILTAYHVAKALAGADKKAKVVDWSKLASDNVYLQFNYLKENTPKEQEPEKYYLVGSLEAGNEEMDFAVLQINEQKGAETTLPPKITNFKKAEDGQVFALLGHPQGKPMIIDPNVKVMGHENGKIYFNCWVEFGASGSPGILMDENDDTPVCILMLLGGYSENVSGERNERNSIEHGITMYDLRSKLMRSASSDQKLAKHIFEYILIIVNGIGVNICIVLAFIIIHGMTIFVKIVGFFII